MSDQGKKEASPATANEKYCEFCQATVKMLETPHNEICPKCGATFEKDTTAFTHDARPEDFERKPDSATVSELESIVASCTCLTKTPEVKYHAESCRYRKIMESHEAVGTFRKPDSASTGKDAKTRLEQVRDILAEVWQEGYEAGKSATPSGLRDVALAKSCGGEKWTVENIGNQTAYLVRDGTRLHEVSIDVTIAKKLADAHNATLK